MPLKLTGIKKWLEAKRALQRKHGIVAHFSDHDGYYTAYKYISKCDEKSNHSLNHPNLNEIGSPKTKNFQRAYCQRPSGSQAGTNTGQNNLEPDSKRMKRLSNIDVSELIVKYNIKNQTELLAIANEQKEEGKKDLAGFVLSRSSKSPDELVQQTWRMNDASSTLKRQKLSRM